MTTPHRRLIHVRSERPARGSAGVRGHRRRDQDPIVGYRRVGVPCWCDRLTDPVCRLGRARTEAQNDDDVVVATRTDRHGRVVERSLRGSDPADRAPSVRCSRWPQSIHSRRMGGRQGPPSGARLQRSKGMPTARERRRSRAADRARRGTRTQWARGQLRWSAERCSCAPTSVHGRDVPSDQPCSHRG